MVIIFLCMLVFGSYNGINNSFFNSPFQLNDIPVNHTSRRRAYIIGVDGIGILPKTTKTPGIYRVIDNGIYTFQAATVYPSLSAESWTSLLHGVSPLRHQISTEVRPKKSFPMDSEYPSIFRVLHEADNKSVMAVFCNWEFIPNYIVENGIGVQKFQDYTEKGIISLFEKFMRTNDPTLVFFQLDDTDVVGHRQGFFTDKQIEQLIKTDKTVGRIIDIIEKYDPSNESLILIQTDHGGGGVHPHMHGSGEYQDMTIFWTARGKGICKNKQIDRQVTILDTARFVASYLKLKIPESWEGENLYSSYQCK